MRLVGAFLFVALAGSLASADDAKPSDPSPAPTAPAKSKVPLRVVRILPETHQALLFDKTKGTHVLADVGKSIDGYLVDDIDDDEVTLTAEGGAQIVLAAPDPTWRRHHDNDREDEAKPAKPAAKPRKATPAPEDPYATATPVDPYGEPSTDVRTVEAPQPIDAGEGGVRTAEAPGSTAAPVHTTPVRTAEAPGSTAPVRTAEAPSSTAAIVAPAPTPKQIADANMLSAVVTGMPVTDALVLSRAEVTTALGDFAKLTASVKGAFTPAGVKLDAVNADSLFAKAGLKAGDLITAVNSQPLKSIDDAANLYARAASTRALLVAVTRANKPITLRVVVQ